MKRVESVASCQLVPHSIAEKTVECPVPGACHDRRRVSWPGSATQPGLAPPQSPLPFFHSFSFLHPQPDLDFPRGIIVFRSHTLLPPTLSI